MKPIRFEEVNVIFAKGQPEYLPLPAYRPNVPRSEDPKGEVIVCLKMGIRERMKVLVTGRVWLKMLTFHLPLQPIQMSVDYPPARSKKNA